MDWIVAREAAVFAVVDALVGKIERREQSDHFAEVLPRERLRTPTEMFEQFTGGGRNQLRKVRQRKFILRQRFAGGGKARGQRTLHQRFERQGIKFSNKAHAINLANREAKSRSAVLFRQR